MTRLDKIALTLVAGWLAAMQPAMSGALAAVNHPDKESCATGAAAVPACAAVSRYAQSRPAQAPVVAPPPVAAGPWRLVRTSGPDQQRDVVSIMRTADLGRSDADFAGLMIRCRDNGALQVGLVVIRPFPPRAKPVVTITTGAATARFDAVVLPSGSILGLPDEAGDLPRGVWQTVPELRISITGEGEPINGVVATDRLAAALITLQASCR